METNVRHQIFDTCLDDWVSMNLRRECARVMEGDCHKLWWWRNRELGVEDSARPPRPWVDIGNQMHYYKHASQINVNEVGDSRRSEIG